MAGYWIVAIQMGSIIPLQAGLLSGSKSGAGIALALSAAITIALQYHLTSKLSRTFSNHAILTAGIIVLSVGYGCHSSFREFFRLVILCGDHFYRCGSCKAYLPGNSRRYG